MYTWDGSEDLSAKVIDDDFTVRENVTSLIGCPKEVTGNFNCSYNRNITTLEGAPEKVGGKFIAYGCSSLRSLKGGPKEVKGRFYCNNCNGLKNLEGAPEKLGDGIECSYCKRLETLKGLPKRIEVSDVIANYCDIETLEGCPEYIDGRLDITGNPLISLKGIVKNVGMIELRNCEYLEVIDDFPEHIEYYVNFEGTDIKDIKVEAVFNFLKNADKIRNIKPEIFKKAKKLSSILKSVKKCFNNTEKEKEITDKIIKEIGKINKIFFDK